VQEGEEIVQRPEPEPEVKGRKRGNELGLWFFIVSLRLFGLRGAYGLLYIVCLYYVLFDRSLVSSAVPYISRRFAGCGILEQHLHVYRLLVSQGKQFIDRYAAASGHVTFEIRLKGEDKFLSRMRNSEKGSILLTSHEGNWQVAMTALKEIGKPVHLVMIPDENPAMERKLYPDREAAKVPIISPRRYLGGVIEILSVLRRGHVVSMMGDRRYGARALDVSFLGDKAWFPYSAFSLAASVECPVVVMKTTKMSTYCYVVDMSQVLYPIYEGRRDRVKQLRPWVQEYVALMESFAQEHPYQCFLLRDVWNEELSDAPA
jgi:predicted LPLAT superfamily acyltransferase